MADTAGRVPNPEDIDSPFQRRRNMGQRNSLGPSRSDVVALALSRATTVREAGDVAVELGAPRGYIDKILVRDCRNSVRLMEIHKAARRFHRLKQEIRINALRKRVCSRVAKQTFRPSH